jgi:hypothetical protein
MASDSDSQVKDPTFDRVSQSFDMDDGGSSVMQSRTSALLIESGIACDGKYCKRPVRVQRAGATP